MAEHLSENQPEAPSQPSQLEAFSREIVDAVAPRINVECFCLSADFAASMRAAMKDRRMARARVTLSMGGVEAAEQRFTENETPHLLIIECAGDGYEMFSELQRLAAVCSPDTNVIAVGGSNDVSIYRELIRQGVGEYLVSPCSPMQIIDAIAGVYADPASAPKAKIISVFGAKGGVGASTLAHNIAWSISRNSAKETILLDLDMEFGTAALDFNIEPQHSLAEALSDVERLDDVKLERILFQHSDKLRLLPSPSAIQTEAAAGAEDMLSLLDTIRGAADVVVIDAPHHWSDLVTCALRQSDEVLLVGTPDIAALRNLKSLQNWLQQERQHDTPPMIALNQFGAPKRPEIALKDFIEVLGAAPLAQIPYDAALFGAALSNGQMLSEVSASHKSVELIDDLADKLLGREPKAKKTASLLAGLELPSMLSRFAKKAK